MISDGFSTDVYDVFQFSGNGTVPVSSALIPWAGNPIQGIGPVNIVETGTTTEIPTSLPAAGNGIMLAIDINGDSVGNFLVSDNNSDGYLDAADSLAAFTMTDVTDVVFQGDTLSHSFYLTSKNTRFEIRARAIIDSVTSTNGNSVSLSGIPFGVSITQSGNDAGLSYGGSLSGNGGFMSIATVDDLGDIQGMFTSVALFDENGIVQNGNGANNNAGGNGNGNPNPNRGSNGNTNIYQKSLRFNMSYGFPALDLSQGEGAVQFRVDYAPYKR